MTAPLWIKTPAEIDALVVSLRGARALSIDTEADGLHHYPVKLCLVQVADDRGRGHLADPLALPTLAPLSPFFADPGVVKVLHAADNDLGYLKRLYGFTVSNLFDTAIAARFLGVTSLSLDGLLREFLGGDPGPSRQKDDWSRRPLSAAQETYALNDVLHLIPLREKLLEALRAKGRDLWVEEECAAVAAMPAPERVIDPDAYMKLKGAKVSSMLGWREYFVSAGEGLSLVDPSLPLSSYLGVLGIPGFTGWYGLKMIGKPKAGETLVVSGAAGATGSMVVQVGKILGCRVVGTAGTDDKCAYLTRALGADAAINYKKAGDLLDALRQACPAGIDIYFENVGGPLLDAVLRLINPFARIPLCGMISQYNLDPPEPGPRYLFSMIGNRALMQGFIISDHSTLYPEFLVEAGRWLKAGRIKQEETVVEGIENATKAFLGLFSG